MHSTPTPPQSLMFPSIGSHSSRGGEISFWKLLPTLYSCTLSVLTQHTTSCVPLPLLLASFFPASLSLTPMPFGCCLALLWIGLVHTGRVTMVVTVVSFPEDDTPHSAPLHLLGLSLSAKFSMTSPGAWKG